MYVFLICVVLSFAVGAQQDSRLQAVIFGDSLSDSGNLYGLTKTLNFEPAIPPSDGDYRIYWEGRFSNGPVWADYLAFYLGLSDIQEGIRPSLKVRKPLSVKAVNYAWGGATSRYVNLTPAGLPVPGILGQVNLYKLGLRGKKAPANATHFAWGGSDDFLLGFTGDPQEVIGNMIEAARQLYELGARRIVIANLPELCLGGSVTPDVVADLKCNSLPDNPERTLTYEYNAGLRDALAVLADSESDADFFLVDIYSAAAQLFTEIPDPGPAAGCLESLPYDPAPCTQLVTGITDGMLGPSIFTTFEDILWDIQHPRTWVHEIISQVMLDALQHPIVIN
jgi:outer membrane lipase/esterase